MLFLNSPDYSFAGVGPVLCMLSYVPPIANYTDIEHANALNILLLRGSSFALASQAELHAIHAQHSKLDNRSFIVILYVMHT